MSSQRQGVLPRLPLPAQVFRHGVNLWPPFLGAGIRVMRVTADYREVDKTLYIRRHRTAATEEPAASYARARLRA